MTVSDGFVNVTFCTTSDDPEYIKRVRGLYAYPRIETTRMCDAQPSWDYGSTGLVSDRLQPVVITPCPYCGRKALSNVYQCLGCRAPR